MRCVQGGRREPAGENHKSGANEHGSANRGTCQEITQPFETTLSDLTRGLLALLRALASSGFFPRAASPPVLSASGAQKRQQSCSAERECWSASRISRGFILRLMSSLLCEHYPTAPATIEVLCYWSHAWSKELARSAVNEINSISSVSLYLSMQKPGETFLQALNRSDPAHSKLPASDTVISSIRH